MLRTRDEIVRLDASPTRFAAATATGVVTGPPARTFAAPALVQFDGERLFTITETGATAYDPDPKPIVLPARSAPELARFAGDLMAVPTTWADRDPHYPSRRLVIQNWRTGAVLRSVDLPDEILSLDLRPDGRAVAVIAAGTLYDIAPGADPRFVAFADPGARFAGDRVVFARANELHGARSGRADPRVRRPHASPGPVHHRRHPRAVHGQRLPGRSRRSRTRWRPTSARARARGRSSNSTRSARSRSPRARSAPRSPASPVPRAAARGCG